MRASLGVILLVAAVVAVVVRLSGWADDKAQPGSTGRVQVKRSAAP